MKVQEALNNTLVMLDALTVEFGISGLETLIDECKSALAEIEKCEPVGEGELIAYRLIHRKSGKSEIYTVRDYEENHNVDELNGWEFTPIHYTSPISKEWLSLTDEQLEEIIKDWATDKIESHRDYADAISSKLKQLNFTK